MKNLKTEQEARFVIFVFKHKSTDSILEGLQFVTQKNQKEDGEYYIGFGNKKHGIKYIKYQLEANNLEILRPKLIQASECLYTNGKGKYFIGAKNIPAQDSNMRKVYIDNHNCWRIFKNGPFFKPKNVYRNNKKIQKEIARIKIKQAEILSRKEVDWYELSKFYITI